ncbi:hypothetical protein GF374_00815 [Candidatus Woesearchaeota archaeon]|nr:hypothetical protein [Candidatus Woesearchaeota archaeon]
MFKEKRRSQIIDWIWNVVKEANDNNKIIDENKLVAECCLTFFCGERLVKEVLKHLVVSQRLIKEDGQLLTEAHSKQLKNSGGKND